MEIGLSAGLLFWAQVKRGLAVVQLHFGFVKNNTKLTLKFRRGVSILDRSRRYAQFSHFEHKCRPHKRFFCGMFSAEAIAKSQSLD